MTRTFALCRFTSTSIVAVLALLGVASATVHAQDGLNEAVVSTYWKSQETSTPLPAGFMPIHLDNQKVGAAVTAFWRGYTLTTTGSVSAATGSPATSGSVVVVTGRPITTDDIDGSHCAPGQLVFQFDTGNLACEWPVAE
jgi:hypothetical protein